MTTVCNFRSILANIHPDRSIKFLILCSPNAVRTFIDILLPLLLSFMYWIFLFLLRRRTFLSAFFAYFKQKGFGVLNFWQNILFLRKKAYFGKCKDSLERVPITHYPLLRFWKHYDEKNGTAWSRLVKTVLTTVKRAAPFTVLKYLEYYPRTVCNGVRAMVYCGWENDYYLCILYLLSQSSPTKARWSYSSVPLPTD